MSQIWIIILSSFFLAFITNELLPYGISGFYDVEDAPPSVDSEYAASIRYPFCSRQREFLTRRYLIKIYE